MEASCTARPIGADIATPAPVDKSRCSGGYGDALSPDQAVQAEKKTAPSKRWRNKWRVGLYGYKSRQTGEVRRPGDIYWGSKIFPSRDLAETAARDCKIALQRKDQYLGAFPVEEGQ